MVRIAAILAASALLPAAAGASPAVSGADTFRMPSGNIYCAYEHYSFAPTGLRCEIRSGIRPLPPRPRACGDAVWGAGYRLGKSGPAHVLCISDTIYDPKAKVLGYGETRRFGIFRCSSSTTGLRCTNGSGQGFLLSRGRSYAFVHGRAATGSFRTPSGNIVCGYGGSSIECGIRSGLVPPPPKASCTAGDPTDKRVSLTAAGRATPATCAGDPGPFLFESKAWTLGYGKTWSHGGIVCDSGRTGLTCRNRAGHGFFLSRERWRSF